MGLGAGEGEVQSLRLRIMELWMKLRGRPECLWQAKIEPTAVGG